jgi:hypothetical protein
MKTTTIQQHILNALKAGTTYEVTQAVKATEAKVVPAAQWHVSRAMVLAAAHSNIAAHKFATK